VLHITGGLRAQRAGGGWIIGPLFKNGPVALLGPFADEDIGPMCREFGQFVFGADETSAIDSALPSRIWRPLLGLPLMKHQPADTWCLIGSAAMMSGDAEYERLAAKISMSLRAAGTRLRDASDEYHRQLIAGLRRGQATGLRFQNISMQDLHLAFHSLLSEMSSARDYLATAAARRVGAPASVDALNRLASWLEKPSGKLHVNDPMISAMLQAWDASQPDPWLHDLTEYRNLFLHREPLGANEHARWLSLVQRETAHGRVVTAQMLLPARPNSNQVCDALMRFVELFGKLCRFSDALAVYAKYAPEPLHFEVAASG
jgi:hypothetical protein